MGAIAKKVLSLGTTAPALTLAVYRAVSTFFPNFFAHWSEIS